ncbi:MAG: PilZ domain-containing protein, partial [gamma proteobacterium symbiont of Bathyaustriella thionipta]|nr:PilZ domain-containing protein [gamma proteobacterium symbiont of Bathyaustriella thionipta]
ITTIESQLKKAVLLTLLDPYRLLEGDVWSAYEYLCFWATKAEIEPLNSKSKAAGRFIMDLWGIKHVRPFNPETTDPAESAGRYHLLNTLPLNQMVNRHLLECQKDKEAIPLGMKNLQQIEAAQLIRRMLLSWHLRPERRSKRYERYGWLKAACGVSAAHHYLHLDQSKEASTPKIDQLDLEVAGLSPMESLEDSDVPSGQFEHKKVNFEFFRWRQINISDGGLAAHVNKPFPSILEVGQLVLMEHESDDQEGWLVAVIRRMMHIDNERIEIGVQFMPGIIQPVSVRSMVVGSSRVDFQPSLLISNERGDQTLVTPCSMYTPGREFLLEDRSRVSRVGAGKLIESTHAFDRFFIHALLKKEAAEGNLQAATLQ